MKADEPGGARDQKLHILRHTVLPPEALSSSASECACAASSASFALTTAMRRRSLRGVGSERSAARGRRRTGRRA
jgi:hypothetical protein